MWPARKERRIKTVSRSQPHSATLVPTSWDACRTYGEGEAGIARRQSERLRNIVSYARTHSAYFANRYRSIPEPVADIRQLPVVVTKEDQRRMMSLHGSGRLAAVFVTGGHFLGNTMMARRLRTMPWRARTQQIFSALAPP